MIVGEWLSPLYAAYEEALGISTNLAVAETLAFGRAHKLIHRAVTFYRDPDLSRLELPNVLKESEQGSNTYWFGAK